jgi:hypothetical protein
MSQGWNTLAVVIEGPERLAKDGREPQELR